MNRWKKDFLLVALIFVAALTGLCFMVGFSSGLAGGLLIAFGSYTGLALLASFRGRVSRGVFLTVNILVWASIGSMLGFRVWWPPALPVTVFIVWLMFLHAQETDTTRDIA